MLKKNNIALKPVFYLKIIIIKLFCIAISTLRSQTLQKIDDITVKDGLQNNAVVSIKKDANGFYWIKSYNTLQRWNGKTFYNKTISTNKATVQQKINNHNLVYYNNEIGNTVIIDSNSKQWVFDNLLAQQNKKDSLEKFVKGLILKQPEKLLYNYLLKHTNNYYTIKNGWFIEDTYGKWYLLHQTKGLKPLSNLLQPYKYIKIIEQHIFAFSNNNSKYCIIENDSIIQSSNLKAKTLTLTKCYYNTNTVSKTNTHILFDNVLLNVKNKIVGKGYEIDEIPITLTNEYSSFYYDENQNLIYLNTFNNGFSIHQLSNNNVRYLQQASETFSYTHYIYKNKLINNCIFFDTYLKLLKDNTAQKIASTFCTIDSNSFIYCTYQLLCVVKNNTCNFYKIPNNPKPLSHFIATDSVLYLCRNTIDKYYPKTNTYITGNKSEWPTFNDELYVIKPHKNPNKLYAVIGNNFVTLDVAQKTTMVLGTGINGNARSIDIDSHTASIFISTKFKGCYVYHQSTIKQLPIYYNNSLISCHYVLQDKEGDYWLPSDIGLFVMQKHDYLSYLKGTLNTIIPKKISVINGLLNEEFNGGYQGSGMLYKDSIVMATMGGSVVFHSSIKKQQTEIGGKLILDYITVDSTEILNPTLVEVPASYKNFEIKVDYPFIHTNGYIEYKIIGSTVTTWQAMRNDGIVQLKNMRAGKYLIVFRPNIKPSEVLEIKFIVKPYWYNTWWAKIVFLIILLVSSYIVFMWRLQTIKNKQLQAQQKSRDKLLAIISHDLKSPIINFTKLAETIKFLIATKDFATIENIGNEMEQKNSNLILLLNNVFKWSSLQDGMLKPKKNSYFVEQILNNIIPSYIDIAAYNAIDFVQVNTAKEPIFTDFDMLSLILRNGLDNALKNSPPNSCILIKAIQDAFKTIITINNQIEDFNAITLQEIEGVLNGSIVAAPHQKNLGLGIAVMYEYSKLIKASLKINFTKTAFTLTITLNNV
jgi:hypothetical protein